MPFSPNDSTRPRLRSRAAAVGLGFGLALGSLAIAGPAVAETSSRDTPAAVDDRAPAPTDVRRDRPDRPVADLEVLQLRCEAADHRPDATRVRIGCRWRAAQSERAAGYQLWRIVDRGHRELVARGGLDLLGHRDVVSANASLVRYAVIAVDENGRRVGQSRVERVMIDDGDDQPTRRHRRISQR